MRQNSYPYSLEPVTREEMFYGHREELEDVISKITAQSRSSFFITGGSRMGKTSLLRQVERRLHQFSKDEQSFNDSVLIPLYMDMLLEERTPNDFFGKAAYLLHRALPNATASLTFSDPAKTLFEDARNLLQTVKSASEEAHRVFISALENLAQAVELADASLRIVFLIDDLWRLKRPEVSLLLSKHLRSLYTESTLARDGVVAYIFAGSIYERKLAFDADSPLENILVVKELQVFDEEQSLALINEPTQGQIREEVARKIYEETGGHPFLLQGLMSTLCEGGNPAQLTVQDVSRATMRFLKDRRDFEHWWEKLSEADRRVYSVFCQQSQTSIDDLHSMMLSVPIEGGRNLLMNRPMIVDSLRTLKTMGLIREFEDSPDEISFDVTYELASQWHARWFIQMNKSSSQRLY